MEKIPHHDAKDGKLDHCQITGSENLFEAIDLGHQPPCDALLTKEQLDQPAAAVVAARGEHSPVQRIFRRRTRLL